MIERRTLEDVLNDLKEAENEYKEKCLKYGITEKVKRKKVNDVENLETTDLNGENLDNPTVDNDNLKENSKEIK